MKYLCLAYGDEKDWRRLSKAEQDALLAQDEVLRQRGDLVAAVEPSATTVRAWDGVPKATSGGFAESQVPLAGFSIIEAPDLERAIELVADTPCARAGGAAGGSPRARLAREARARTHARRRAPPPRRVRRNVDRHWRESGWRWRRA